MVYLEKYMYYSTMSEMLYIVKRITHLDEEHKKETATYHFYEGVIIAAQGESNTAIEHFQKAFS